MTEGTPSYQKVIQAKISNYRNPPSFLALNSQWEASVRIKSTLFEKIGDATYSTEAITPF